MQQNAPTVEGHHHNLDNQIQQTSNAMTTSHTAQSINNIASENLHFSDSDFENILNSHLNMPGTSSNAQIPTGLQITPTSHSPRQSSNQDLTNLFNMNVQQQTQNIQQQNPKN